jgi:hypothetical protein
MATPIYTTATAPGAPAVTNVATTGLLTTPTGYTADADLAGTGYTANTGTSTGYTSKDWSVDSPQTVTGQVKDIVTAGGPLMKQAEARSNMRMNSRGLLNSSLAVGAGQSALYDAALPMAQADAQTNAQAANFNANAANAASAFTADATNKQSLVNQDATNRASEFQAGATNSANAANQSATNAAAEFAAAAGNRLTEQGNTITAQASQANADAANKASLSKLDVDFKTSISNADAASKAQLQSMADQTKNDLAAIESTYKQMISSNEQAGALYGKVLQNITDIVNNPDITAADKTTAIENQKTMLKTGMEVVSAVSGLDLGSILTF